MKHQAHKAEEHDGSLLTETVGWFSKEQTTKEETSPEPRGHIPNSVKGAITMGHKILYDPSYNPSTLVEKHEDRSILKGDAEKSKKKVWNYLQQQTTRRS
jgi:hypothetical protein